MENVENKLAVRNLTISFRTTNGRVQAVRGINFDLAKGETLAIVGESGSGKSVTSKAILGILAGNAMIEAGEIIYDGKDLMKLSEEEFHRIRGDKIAMIFQAPMSSLNPIVRIGRQLTEAMILKGKARQRESRECFNEYLKNLKLHMISAIAGDSTKEGYSKETADAITQKCQDFDKFEYKHLDLEAAYRTAYEAATEAVDDIKELVFEMEKNAVKDAIYRIREIAKMAKMSVQEYVVKEDGEKLQALAAQLGKDAQRVKKADGNYDDVIGRLNEVREILEKAIALPEPNFFCMGYYVAFSGKELPVMSDVNQLNVFLHQYLDDNFMLDFIADAKKGMMHAAEVSYEKKKEAIAALKEQLPVFEKEELNAEACRASEKILIEKINATINKLEIIKDNVTYTFPGRLKGEIDRYFSSIIKNKEEQKRYEKAKAKYDGLVSRGRTPEWKVVEAKIVDLEEVRADICRQIERMIKHFEDSLAQRDNRDYDKETVAAIDYLKENASAVVNKVTKQVAKAKAIKLMEEVGIAEPRKRFRQYPFEFSGGMRQRIVIAIALAANPDILICDEPTTALDVTIQAQILELINKLKEERHLSVIFITHDLGVVANMADRIAVMYAGKVVEYGTVEDVFYHAAHPYTWALLSSMPDLDTNEKLEAIPGTPPNMIYPPVGDAFAPRNKYALKIDFEKQPPMFQITDTHYAATWLLHPDAPKVEMPKVIMDRIARMQQKREEEEDAE